MMKGCSKKMCVYGVSVNQRSDVNTWRYSARKVREIGRQMVDILVYVSCKFEMYIFKIAQVISENVRIAFLYVLSIYQSQLRFLPVIGVLSM